MKKVHFASGLILTIFIGIHLANHVYGIIGVGEHIDMMNTLRTFYRSIFIESILLCAVFVQIISGLLLFKRQVTFAVTSFERLHIWTGLYLAVFLVIHVSAVLVGRTILHLDTNFYFGVAGINSFPLNLFFIPYYGLAIISFYGHLSAIHRKKMKRNVLTLTPRRQAITLLITGVLVTFVIFYGLTNRFKGVAIPQEYNILIGK